MGARPLDVGTQPLDLPELMGLMATVDERSESFTETRTLSLLTRPVRLHGTLIYRRPHYIEKRIERPHPERIMVDGSRLALTQQGRTTQFNIDSHPLIRAYVEAIRATLAGDIAALRRHYHVLLDGSLSHWRLRLRPLDPAAAEYLTSVTLAGAGTRVDSVTIRESNGDHSVLRIAEGAP